MFTLCCPSSPNLPCTRGVCVCTHTYSHLSKHKSAQQTHRPVILWDFSSPALPAAQRCTHTSLGLPLRGSCWLHSWVGVCVALPLPHVGLLCGPGGESDSRGHSPSSKTVRSKGCTSPLGRILAAFPRHSPLGRAAPGSWKTEGTASPWSLWMAPALLTP